MDEYKYDVALSFAGEDRDYVSKVAELLKNYGLKVFYDGFEETNLWGKNLYEHLNEVYGINSKYTVIFISKNYKKKLWTNHERQIMQARAFEENKEYILPARFDDTEIPGILKTIAYISLKDKSPSEFSQLIIEKLKKNSSSKEQSSIKIEVNYKCFPIEETLKENNKIDEELILGSFISPIDVNSKPFFHEVKDAIQDKKNGSAYIIHGEPGVGKTIVAKSLSKYIQNNYYKKVIFVDIMEYEKRLSKNICTKDGCLKELEDGVISDIKEGDKILIVDGVDILNPLSTEFFRLLFQYINNNISIFFSRQYKGISVINEDQNINAIQFTVKYECGLYSSKKNINQQIKANCLLEDLFQVGNHELLDAKEIMSTWFFENRQNIRLLSILLKKITLAKIKIAIKNPSEYFDAFLKTYLTDNTLSAESIEKITKKSKKFAYDLLVNGEFSPPSSAEDFFVKRISTQSFEMLGYLSAKYICEEILRLSNLNSIEKLEIDSIDNVYPYLVNKYAKEIINKNADEQRRYFKAIEKIYENSSSRLQAFLCYLLGRFTHNPVRQKSIKFLYDRKEEIDKKSTLKPSNEFLVLHRTIYISLIYQEKEKDDEYIKALLRNRYLDAINRGFHRQYYGDGDYILDRDMVSDDSDLGSFLNTFRQIKDKLTSNVKSSDGTLNLSLYTLLSLSLSRKQVGKLHETVEIEEILSLIDRAEKEIDLHKVVLNYLQVVRYYLNKNLPPLTESLILMYQLKTKKRSGWNYISANRIRKVPNPESVSEHTDFCVRIAQIFLPDDNQVKNLIPSTLDDSYKNYSKFKIISLLSNHDLGEYLHGDIIRLNQTEKDRENEAKALKKLSMLTSCYISNILANPHESIYSPWSEYNYGVENNINHKIAKDIDNIECLMQLLIYNADKENHISDIKEFKDELANKIYTKIGKEIVKVIIDPLINSMNNND